MIIVKDFFYHQIRSIDTHSQLASQLKGKHLCLPIAILQVGSSFEDQSAVVERLLENQCGLIILELHQHTFNALIEILNSSSRIKTANIEKLYCEKICNHVIISNIMYLVVLKLCCTYQQLQNGRALFCICLRLKPCVLQIGTFGYHNMKHRLFVEFTVEEKEEF